MLRLFDFQNDTLHKNLPQPVFLFACFVLFAWVSTIHHCRAVKWLKPSLCWHMSLHWIYEFCLVWSPPTKKTCIFIPALISSGGGKLETCVLRPCGIYGPGERRHLHRVMVSKQPCLRAALAARTPVRRVYIIDGALRASSYDAFSSSFLPPCMVAVVGGLDVVRHLAFGWDHNF